MYRTILVPLDESPLGERALPYAAVLAQRSGARLILLEVAVANIVTRNDPQTGQPYTVDLAAQYLSGVAARLKAGVAVETIERRGEAGDEIVAESRRQRADLIVMSTHESPGIGRWLYGSVADHVLRHARVPVLVVPATADRAMGAAPDASGGGVPLTLAGAGRASRILLALDGSELSLSALGAASDLATVLGASLHLLRIAEPLGEQAGGGATGALNAPPDPGAELAAKDYLEDVAVTLRQRGHEVRVAVDSGPVAAAIAGYAREQMMDVIVMATHGRGGLARLVSGSVATETLRLSPVPLLLLRPPTLADAGAGRG